MFKKEKPTQIETVEAEKPVHWTDNQLIIAELNDTAIITANDFIALMIKYLLVDNHDLIDSCTTEGAKNLTKGFDKDYATIAKQILFKYSATYKAEYDAYMEALADIDETLLRNSIPDALDIAKDLLRKKVNQANQSSSKLTVSTDTEDPGTIKVIKFKNNTVCLNDGQAVLKSNNQDTEKVEAKPKKVSKSVSKSINNKLN